MERDIRPIAYHHRDVINEVIVRPIFQTEREKRDALIEQHQYLGLKSMVEKHCAMSRCLKIAGWHCLAGKLLLLNVNHVING